MKMWFFIPKKTGVGQIVQDNFTIGITTFKDRFEEYFKSYLKHLVTLFPNTRIIVIANGHVDQEGQLNYLIDLDQMTDFISNYFVIDFNNRYKLYNETNYFKRSKKLITILNSLIDEMKNRRDSEPNE